MRTKLVTQPKIICNSLTNIVIIIVTESAKFILEVNVMSQSDFSVKVNSQTKKEVEKWTKKPAQENGHNAFTDFIWDIKRHRK